MTSRRHGRWELLGHADDPVPSDAGDILDIASDYRSRGNDLDAIRDVLDDLSDLTGWHGAASETFAAKAGDRAGDIGKAAARYAAAAEALETYASAVYEARNASWSALNRAEDAESRRSAASHDPLAGVTDPTPQQSADGRRRLERLDAAQGDLSSARSALEEALNQLDSAARKCANAIRDAADDFKDGWFDDFQGFVRDHADIIKAVVEVLKVIAAVVAVITLVVVMIATAPAWLIAAGIALAAAVLVLDAMLLTAGEATWGDVAWDAAGLALSFVGGGATLRLGAQLSSRLSVATTRVLASVQQGARGSTPLVTRVLQSVRLPGLSWIGRFGDDLAEARVDRIVTAATERIAGVRPSGLDRLRALDGELATQIRKIAELRSFQVPAATGLLDEASGLANQIRGINVGLAVNDLDGAADAFGSPVSIGGLVGDGIDGGIDAAGRGAWRLEHLR